MTESIMRTVVAANLGSNTRKTTKHTVKKATAWRGIKYIQWLFSLLLLSVLLGGGFWAIRWILTTNQFAIAKIRFEGEIRHTNPALLQNIIAKQMKTTRNFFAINLGLIRRSIEKLPWVTEVHVRRVWPLTVIVWIREHEALARWGQNKLVSQQGVVFTPGPKTIPQGLPYLEGPDHHVPKVIEYYKWLNQQLTRHKLHITKLRLSTRHAWYVALSNGLVLYLGTKTIQMRVKRFLRYFPKLLQPQTLVYIDLRYVNGFAVKRHELANTDTD